MEVGSACLDWPPHGNMLGLTHQLEPESAKAMPSTSGHRQETWPLRWDGGFRNGRFRERGVIGQDFGAKRLDMKADRGFDVREGFLISAAFAAADDSFMPRGYAT